MDKECIGMWRTIIDNLFTQDQASFRELVARATVTPNAALSFFGNHEQVRKYGILIFFKKDKNVLKN